MPAPQLRSLRNCLRSSSAAPLLVLLLAPIAQSAAAAAATLFRESTRTDLPTTGKGFGATWADTDGDGRLDLLLNHHGAGVSLYLALPELGFARAAPGIIPHDPGVDHHGIAACDYDNDGDWDLYVTAGAERGEGTGPNQMWMRGGDGRYTNALPATHLMADVRGRGRGALWVRLDNDRYPELVVLNYQTPTRLFRYDGRRWGDRSPDLNPYLRQDSPRRHWTESVGYWFSVGAAGDLDRDGHADLVLAGDGHFLFHNDGTGGLVDVAGAAGLPEKVRILVDIVPGDVDNDGDLDLLYVFRWKGGVQLWLNESTPGHVKFREGPSLAHLPLQPELDSALLADFDNDGALDLYVVMQDSLGTNTPNLFARGRGDGRFTDASATWGAAGLVSALPCGAWPVDLDRDGDLDLLLLHGKEDFPDRGGLTVLYENTSRNAAGLTLELVTGGGAPHGLGARVELRTRTGRQTREVRSEVHYWNASVLPLHFGVGDDPGPYRALVIWPNGVRQDIMLPVAGTAYRLHQGAVAAEDLAGAAVQAAAVR